MRIVKLKYHANLNHFFRFYLIINTSCIISIFCKPNNILHIANWFSWAEEEKKTHKYLSAQFDSNSAAVVTDDFSCVQKCERNEHTNEYETNTYARRSIFNHTLTSMVRPSSMNHRHQTHKQAHIYQVFDGVPTQALRLDDSSWDFYDCCCCLLRCVFFASYKSDNI